MIVLNVQWCDLVRYNTTKGTACVYRVIRDPVLEDRLMQAWIRAEANTHRLQELVHTDGDFISLRAHLDSIAIRCEAILTVEPLP